MQKMTGFALQKPITMRVIASFHELSHFDNFEIYRFAVSLTAATEKRLLGGGESI